MELNDYDPEKESLQEWMNGCKRKPCSVEREIEGNLEGMMESRKEAKVKLKLPPSWWARLDKLILDAYMEYEGSKTMEPALVIGKFYTREDVRLRDGIRETYGPAKHNPRRRKKQWRVGGRWYWDNGCIYEDGRWHKMNLVAEGDPANVQKRRSFKSWLRKLRGK